MRAYVVEKGADSLDGLTQVEMERPSAGPGEVLVRMRAAALNYRDQAIVAGKYIGGSVPRDTIPLSDGAGEVEAVGEGVSRFKPGDRVITAFFANWSEGPPPAKPAALGSPFDGALAEYRVFPEAGLAAAPPDLSFEEAATLTCAGSTAWQGLVIRAGIKPGQTVLCLGTGGVSIYGLQIAKMAGAKVIITSSSDDKLDRARKLGADATINYAKTPEWQDEVMRLTAGRGVDIVVEAVGPATLVKSYQCVAYRGQILLIGVIGAPGEGLFPHPLMFKGATLHGLFVGPRVDLEGLAQAMTVNGMRPVVDKVFPFDQAREAYEYEFSGKHFGKVAIAI